MYVMLSCENVLRWAVLREAVRIRSKILGWTEPRDIYEATMEEFRSCNVQASNDKTTQACHKCVSALLDRGWAFLKGPAGRNWTVVG